MRILAIRGKNLASLGGEFEVDFSREPLNKSSIVAITGSTGSGKSTILDAMCIALYESSPRLDTIKNSKNIEEFGKTGLKEDNVRTIMRRGTTEAYAEVDFTAVDGCCYRARWSIKRRNNSPNGAFAPAACSLENLETNEMETLPITEYKSKVQELIGLTYEQFKRAVLLAQGNFAAFLKADENDKAMILQTLTDTGIYSEISTLIYKRFTQAECELRIIEEKKKGLQLLTPEQTAELEEELKDLLRAQDENEKITKRLTLEKQWTEHKAALEVQLAAATYGLNAARKEMELMDSDIERLKLIDSLQEIRDIYTRYTSIEQEHTNNQNRLKELKVAIQSSKEELKRCDERVKKAQETQDCVGKEYEAVKPLINQAVKIEASIVALQKRVKELEYEINKIENEKSRITNAIEKDEKKSSLLKEEQERISGWFNENKRFEHIIPSVPVLITNISSIETSVQEADRHKLLLAKEQELLENHEKRLLAVKEREAELAKTLSSEIAALRMMLKENEPCPVCGSLHHEYSITQENTLAEKELEKAKRDVKNEIEHLTACIQNCKEVISKQKSAIETYLSSIERIKGNSRLIIGEDSVTASLIEKKNAKQTLTTLAEKWRLGSERNSQIKEELSLLCNSTENNRKRVNELQEDFENKNKTYIILSKEVNDLKSQHTLLLGNWKSCEAAEQFYSNRVAAANKEFSSAVEARSNATECHSRQEGEINEKEKLVVSQARQQTLLSAEIAAYLAERDDNIDLPTLKSIMAISTDTITSIRNSINKASKHVATAEATLAERERNMEEHLASPSRPALGTDIGDIMQNIATTAEERKAISSGISRINATLLKDKENNALFEQYKDEYDKKEKNADAWRKLNNTFGSAKGEKLMRITQGYTLDILLDVANAHLKDFSGRYMLSRISSDSLAIKVIDLEMMSESRSVHSLSGGETFLASLALSLALSSISSSKMSVESLFIDEGFGALDKETLNSAMDALEQLQSRGRNICVISHLTEMLDRIPVKIKVAKGANGKSRIETIG